MLASRAVRGTAERAPGLKINRHVTRVFLERLQQTASPSFTSHSPSSALDLGQFQLAQNEGSAAG